MFTSGNGKSSRKTAVANEKYDKLKKQNPGEGEAGKPSKSLTTATVTTKTKLQKANQTNNSQDNSIDAALSEERQQFLINDRTNNQTDHRKQTEKQLNNHKDKRKKVAILAKQETIEDSKLPDESSCTRMLFNIVKRKKLFIPLIIILLIAAVYSIPFIEIDPRTPKSLPHIPFNFNDGPLRESSISQLKIEHLFNEQIRAAESLAFDSTGNLYMAVEGGLILYAHLNKSSPLKRSYYDNPAPIFDPLTQQQVTPPIDPSIDFNDLVKIAELNGIKLMSNNNQFSNSNNRRGARDSDLGSTWRRECQLDEKIYGPHLYTATATTTHSSTSQKLNEIDLDQQFAKSPTKHFGKFQVNFGFSRCSKPLGIRLSEDENYLYVVDTLSGLYQVNLKQTDRKHSTQRLVTKLIDFRNQRYKLLPVIDPSFDYLNNNNDINIVSDIGSMNMGPFASNKAYLNVSFIAVDDLVIDPRAGTNNGDVIYLSIASQNWGTFSFLFDLLEGKPSGAIVRYDTGSKQLAVLNPNLLSHVRTSSLDLTNSTTRLYSTNHNDENNNNNTLTHIFLGLGAPHLNADDIFDDRPLHFANGLELTDDRQAILIADTFNKRILKHFIRGPRKGATDLWAWTPHHPDNIRRGFDKRHETYWTIGCASDPNKTIDLLEITYFMPRLRKYILKNYYLIGWLIEFLGKHIFNSNNIIDFGFSLKHGNTFAEFFCEGMMILQFNKYGDVIRSIYSKEFPSNVKFYSQVNEIIDANNQEHALYLGSPSYKYVTKLLLPTDSFDL